MDHPNEGGKELIPCRVEEVDPTFPWSETYGLLRLKGLNPTEKSSLFSLVHELLPSKDRVSRIIPTSSPLCTNCDANLRETYLHCFFECSSNSLAASSMLECAKTYDQALTPTKCLRLDVRADDPFTLPTVVLLATGLLLIWTNRKFKKATSVWTMRAELEARVQLLRRCRTRRLREAGNILNNIIVNFYN